MSAVIAVAGVAVLYAALAVYGLRRRVVGRLAVKEAIRRPGQTILVIGGLMVGTATITAGFVAADSVAESVTESFVYRQFGHIDLTVAAAGRPFPASVAADLASSPEVAAVTDGVTPGLEATVAAADLDTRQGASQVALVGFDPATRAPFGEFSLLDGRTTLGADLASGDVLVSRLLAAKLGAATGDRLRLGFAATGGSSNRVVRIAGVARAQGPGAYTLGPAVFAPLPTAREITGSDGVNVVWVSAPGGVRGSLAAAAAAAPVIRDALRHIDPSLEVREAKAAEIDNVAEFTVFIRALLVALSVLVMAGGAALIVNLVNMLAEERRSRLGVLRALGLRRRGLVGLALIEGALYSLAAGVVGALVGAVAGRVVAERFGQAFAEFAGDDVDFEFFYSVEPATLVAGFAVGTLITLAVVGLTARRTARMTITAAIRDLPEPPAVRTRHSRRRTLLAGVVVVGGAAGLLSGEPLLRLLGGIGLVLVAAAAVRPRLSARAHASATGLALAAWSFIILAAESGPEEDAAAFFSVFVVATLTSVFGLTLAVAANLGLVERAVALAGRTAGRWRAILRPPLAYLARRPLRTGLTTGVFALIVGMLTLFAVFYVIFQGDYERYGGGYDVRVVAADDAGAAVPPGLAGGVDRTLVLPTRAYVGPVESNDQFSSSERLVIPLIDLPPAPDGEVVLPLQARADEYATEADVWAAVAADATLAVTNLGVPGGELTLQSPTGPVTYTIAGSQMFGLVDGVVARPDALAPFAALPSGVTTLFDLADRADAGPLAEAVERELFASGAEADTVAALLAEVEGANRAFLSTLDVLMRLGLAVGLLSLGIIGLRIVVERRHVIGVLRALGYRRRSIMAGLLAESLATTAIGAGVGVVVGLVMGFLFHRQDDAAAAFGIDVSSLATVLALMFGAVVLLTVVPAWRAAHLPPAEAVRHSE